MKIFLHYVTLRTLARYSILDLDYILILSEH